MKSETNSVGIHSGETTVEENHTLTLTSTLRAHAEVSYLNHVSFGLIGIMALDSGVTCVPVGRRTRVPVCHIMHGL